MQTIPHLLAAIQDSLAVLSEDQIQEAKVKLQLLDDFLWNLVHEND